MGFVDFQLLGTVYKREKISQQIWISFEQNTFPNSLEILLKKSFLPIFHMLKGKEKRCLTDCGQ